MNYDKEKLIEAIKELKEIIEEVFGTEGDPTVKGAILIILADQIREAATPPFEGVSLQRLQRVSLPKARPPGCPHITDLTCSRTGNLVEWKGKCTFLDTDCHNIEKALSFNDYCTCHTYMANKLLDARCKENGNND